MTIDTLINNYDNTAVFKEYCSELLLNYPGLSLTGLFI